MGKGAKAGKRNPKQKADLAVRREWDLIRGDIEKAYAKYMLPLAVEEAFIMLMSVGCIILHDYFGFGKVRMNRWVEHVLDYQDSLYRDYVTIDEVAEEIQRMTGYYYALSRQDVETMEKYGIEGLIEEIQLLDKQREYLNARIARGWETNINRRGEEII